MSAQESEAQPIEYRNGTRLWSVNGLIHRVDGPAIEYPGGRREWWVNGKNFTEKQFFAQATEENRARALHAIAVHEMRIRLGARKKENVS